MSIEHVEPNHNIQGPQHDDLGHFRPPSRGDAYRKGPLDLFRWQDGDMTKIATNGSGWRQDRGLYCVATLFSQQDRTDHLLAVDLDATSVDLLPSGNHRWSTLSFEHIPVQSPNARPTYSKITMQGPEGKMAAPGSAHIVNQILPKDYDYAKQINEQGREIEPTLRSAGLIGNLSVLIALAVFSAPKNQLRQILEEHVQMNQWVPHQYPTGRKWHLSH